MITGNPRVLELGRRSPARLIEHLQLEEGDKLGSLLALLNAELYRRTGIDEGVPTFATRPADAEGKRVSAPSFLSEREVDQLLGDRRLLSGRLRELYALEAAAEAWSGALAELRGVLTRQSEDGSPRHDGETGRPEARLVARNPPLCEADDEYWYL